MLCKKLIVPCLATLIACASTLPVHAQKALPEKVSEMRELILSAARSGKIEALREAMEWNELPPSISKTKIDDPIAYLKKQSGDGEGVTVLARLITLLSGTPARRKQPSDGPVYVWPKLVDVPYAKLTPKERVAVLAGLSTEQVKAVTDGKPYHGYVIVIGNDGTWHTFLKE